MKRLFARIAAVVYILWGVAHVAGGGLMLAAALQGADPFLQAQTGIPGLQLESASSVGTASTAAARVFAFHSFNLIWLGVFTSVIAAAMNWNNSSIGFWLNMVLVGCTDLGLALFLVIPGLMAVEDAWIGPVLFVIALAFSALARFQVRAPDRVTEAVSG